jgi:hypothetical protein
MIVEVKEEVVSEEEFRELAKEINDNPEIVDSFFVPF